MDQVIGWHEYGMAGFGLFVLVVIWNLIVKPTLSVLESIVKQQKEILVQQTENEKSQQIVLSTLQAMQVSQNLMLDRLVNLTERGEEWTAKKV